MFNSIRNRLLTVILMIVASSMFGYYQLSVSNNDIYQQQSKVDSSYEFLTGLESLQAQFSDLESNVRGFLLTGDRSYLEAYGANREQLHVIEADLKGFMQENTEVSRGLHRITHQVGRKLIILSSAIELYKQGELQKSLQVLRSGKVKSRVMAALLEKATASASESLFEHKKSLDLMMQGRLNSTLLWVLFNCVLAFFLMALLFTRILTPITKIMHMAHDFKDGELKQRLEFKNDDELSELGHAFIEMADEIEGQHQEMRAKDELNRQYSSIVAMLAAANDREMALAEVLAMISMHFPIPVGAVYLLDTSQNELELAMVHGLDELELENGLLSASLLGETVKSGEFFEVKYLQNTGVLIDAGVVKIEPKSIVLIPIIYRANTIGVMALALLQDLSTAQLHVLNKLVIDIAVAMKDIERFEQLEILNKALEVSREQLQQERDIAVEDSITDGLTKVYNRGYLDISLPALLKCSKRKQESLSLFMLDIDYFKKVNDNYGHAAGDEVLRCVAKSMQNSLRETDFVARYGGEEFICILPNTDLASASMLANKLREVIELETYTCMDGKSVTASMGVALLNDADETLSVVIERADKALYHAKKSGRNRVVCDVDM